MEELDLKKFAETVWQRKWIVVSIVTVFLIIGVIYTFFIVKPKYKSQTQVLLTSVESTSAEQTPDSITQTDVTLNKNLVNTYSKLIKSRTAIKNVKENLNLDNISDSALANMITVSTEDTSLALTISVVNADAKLAQDIANEVTNVFIKQNEQIYHVNNVSIIDQAELATSPYNIHHGKDIVIFGALGVFVSLGLMLLIYMIDTSIKGPEDIEYLKMQVAGTIPLYEPDTEEKMGKSSNNTKNKELIVMNSSKSPVTEAFRTLRTNIVYNRGDEQVGTILITSPNSQEGKSFVAANLAVMFSKMNKKVLIIDADMRKGRQNKIFRVSNGGGLSNCLRDMGVNARMDVKQLSKYIKTTKIPNLHIMTAGDKPSNSTELLSASRMIKLIEMITSIYDLVIFDGTPSAIVSDSIAISKFMDKNYIVASYKSTKLEALDKVRKAIENVGSTVNGVILNKYELDNKTYSSTYYYDSNLEKHDRKLDEQPDKIKSVEDLINEASKNRRKRGSQKPGAERHINFDLTSYDGPDINSKDDSRLPATVSKSAEINTDLINMKLENMSSEIATIKNILIQFMMNNNQVTSDDIQNLKEELNQMRLALDNNPATEEVRDLREELDGIRKITEEMKDMQRSSNERVKKFLMDYKNKKRVNSTNNANKNSEK